MSDDDLDQPVSNQIEEIAEGPLKSASPNAGEGEQGPDPGPTESLYVPAAVPEGAGELLALDTSGLRTIGEATFGPPPPIPETVHGPDDRIRVEATSEYPWRVHASLRILAADGSAWIGTAWFISATTLITAGHVVFIHSHDSARHGWVRHIEVIPGRNGSEMPFGSITASKFFSVVGWTEHRNSEYDYAAIVLPDGERFPDLGWIGYGAFSDADLKSAHLNISGYPGDKPDGTQWYDHRVTDSVSERKVFYDIDTYGGQSGSAVYQIINGERYAVGIHAYGGAVVNSATRINPRRFRNISAWEQGILETS